MRFPLLRRPLAGFLSALVLLIVAAAPAWAQVDPSVIERQNQIIERQQQERLRQEQERAMQPRGPREGTDLGTIEPRVNVPDLGVPCRDIREIRIRGADLLPDQTRRQIEQDYTGRCLESKDLEAILAALTKNYIDRGYVTTRAYLPPQDLRSGVLEITVIEGTIERFDLDQSGDGAKPSIPGAFPARPGERLNLRDLEQGIDQLNSLASNAATLDLRPGSQPGQSVVVVRNQSRSPVNLYLGYDNLGTPATGRDSASATLGLAGLLGLNEMIAVTRIQSAPRDGEHHADVSALAVSVPWGYSTLSFNVSRGNYLNMLDLPSGSKLAAEGATTSHSLGLDRVVFRDQASRVSLNARLARQDSRNYLGGEYLAVASRALSTLELGSTFFTQAAGGIVNGHFGYVRGLKLFGAAEDPPGLPADLPHAQFTKFVLDLGYNRRFDAGGQPVAWSSQFSAQSARDTLHGSQQFLIGGPGSVRGSLINTLSGDNGWLWRNSVSLPWQTTLGEQSVSGSVYAAYDFGRVGNRAPSVPSGSMSGLTLGLTLAWHGLSLDLFAARTVHLPARMAREDTFYGARLSYAL
jgi:hemolysin activation/secretion protein